MSASARAAAPNSGRRAQLFLLSLAAATAGALCVVAPAGAQARAPEREPIHDHGNMAPPPPGAPATLPSGSHMMLHMQMTPLANGDHADI